MKSFDLAIIGSGPGGYVAALYAARHNLKICVIEKDLLGGTCLNRGCIPTKSLLNSASILSTIRGAGLHGIEVSSVTANFDKIAARKKEVVLRLRTGIETLFRAGKIELIYGKACITGRDTIDIDGKETISAKDIIIAAGSRPFELPNIKFDHTSILSSDDILGITSVPKSLAIVGGGVIGCEFASLFNTLGSKVTIVELTERLIPTQSKEASKKLEVIFKKRGIDIYLNSKAEDVVKGSISRLAISSGKTIEAESVLVSVGRSPDTEGLGDLEKLGIKKEKNRVAVDEYLRTGAKNIYAIGDCVAGPQLAHKASYDGILACDNILGKARKVDYSNIPNCIWTDPEIASVGLTEEDARLKYPDVRIAKFPYIASGKAYIKARPEGFVKMIGDSKGAILGVEIFGEDANELIAEAALARSAKINIYDWSRVVHGHPTLSEILQEAAHVFCGTPIHSI